MSRGFVLMCFLALSAQLVLAIPRLSATYDEPIYTAIGYSDLTTGDLRWHGVIGHGPLANLLTAWPLLVQPDRPDVTELPSWGSDSSLEFGREVLAGLGSLQRTLFVTRVPVTWLALILAAVAVRWARCDGGRVASLVAAVLFCFEPNLIAHGQLNTTDMGVTLCGFAGTHLLSRYLRKAGLGVFTGAGVLLGAAIASKTSGLFFVGAYGLVISLHWLGDCRQRRQFLWRYLGHCCAEWAGLVGIGLLALWAAYGFEMGPVSTNGLPVPAPSHWLGLSYQRQNLTVGQTTFISGTLYQGGHWTYFLVTLLLKTPLPLLAGLLLAALVSVYSRAWERHAAMVVPPIAYIALSMGTGLNIGHRHLLPALPFLLVLVALSAVWVAKNLVNRRVWCVGLTTALAVWYVLGTVRVFPHYLAYFNELAGGPAEGYRYLADSNTDWGQGFYELRQYLAARQASDEALPRLPVRLAAFSSIDPEWYGLDYQPLPPTHSAPVQLPSRFSPEPGLYVISVVPLQGIWLLDPDTYDWFRHQEPIARVAHTLNVYEVRSSTSEMRYVAQCATPTPPLDNADLEEGFAWTLRSCGLRTVSFNCYDGWLYPRSDGWLVLPDSVPATRWVRDRLAGSELTFSQREHWSHPGLTIYGMSQSAQGAQPAVSSAFQIAPTGLALDRALHEGVWVQGPVTTSGPLAFLGYSLHSDESDVTLETFWRVLTPAERPLSLMAHLLDAGGGIVSIADGLSVPIESWITGDTIVQRHSFQLPESHDDQSYVQIGAYWLDTMERWSLYQSNALAGDRILVWAIGE